MTRSQGWHLIGIAWLAMAAFDKPYDPGTGLYLALAGYAFISAVRATP